MTDQEKSDHWELLASTFGATPLQEETPPPPSVQEAEPAETTAEPVSESVLSPESVSPSQDIMVTLPQATYTPPPPEPRKTPQDSARLASELGLELPPEPEPPVVEKRAEPVVEKRAGLVVDRSSWEEDALVIEEASMVDEASVNEEDSVVMETEDLGPDNADLDTIDDSGRSPRTVGTVKGREREWERRGEIREEHVEGRTGEGRRRRRRRRPSRPQADVPGETSEPARELAPDVVVSQEFEDVLELPSDEASEGTADAESSGEDRSFGRTRRRRRRRGGAGREHREEETRTDAAGSAPGEAEIPEEAIERTGEDVDLRERQEADEPQEADEEEDHEELDELTDGASDKAVHRAIPSWSEAVNIVIGANLESRAKKP